LARLVAEAVEAGGLTVAEALEQSRGWDRLDPTQRLFDYYSQSWDRVCAREEPESLATLAGLMAAAQGWVSEDQIIAILGWYEREVEGRRERYWTWGRLRNVLLSLTWFLERRDGPARTSPFYQIRHQSVRDYLLSPSGPVPLAGLAEMHRAVGNYYRREAERNRGWARLDPYGRFQAVRHLLLAGDRESHETAVGLLCDLDYLQGTLGDEPPERTAGEATSES
jgi:hypothetical protein